MQDQNRIGMYALPPELAERRGGCIESGPKK